MYWPIGAPKTYAASKQSPPERSRSEVASNDGLDAQVDATQDDNIQASQQHESGSVHEPFQNVSSSEIGSPSAQEIVDVKIARGGHLFASITKSSLTVWQTKASDSIY